MGFDDEALRRSLGLPKLSATEGLLRTLERQDAWIKKLTVPTHLKVAGTADLFSKMAPVIEAGSLADMIGKMAEGMRRFYPEAFEPLSMRMFHGIDKAVIGHKSLLDSFAGGLAFKGLAMKTGSLGVLTADFSAAHQLSAAAERLLVNLPWHRFGERIHLSITSQRALARSTARLTHRFGALCESADASGPHATLVVPEATIDAPVDVLTHTQCLHIITTEETPESPIVRVQVEVVESTYRFVEEQLAALKPKYLSMLRGARQSVTDRQPDWMRHAGSSYRQLLKNVLHRVAPTADVRQWTKDPLDLDDNGFPKHATKVRWICREVRPDELRDYMIEQLCGALKVIGVFNTAVHADTLELSEDEFAWITLEAERTLRRMLELRRTLA